MNNAMNYIYEVYKERSISAAAKKLYITQPALSACIKKVESEIGIPLFDRNTLPIQLTEAGELYIDAIRKILQVEKELKQQLEDLSNLERGHLSVAGANFFSSYILPPIIHEFSNRYPGVDIELIESESNELYDMALMDHVDLILDAGTYDEKLFDSEFLHYENILFAVPANHPMNEHFRDRAFTRKGIIADRHLGADIPSVPLEAFQDVRFILLKKGHDMHRRSIAMCEQAGIEPREAMYLNQLSTTARISAEGMGCSFLTDTVIKKVHIREDALFFYKLDNPLAKRSMFIAFQQKTLKSKAVTRFLALAKEMCCELPTDQM